MITKYKFTKPYPWRCMHCREKCVYPTTTTWVQPVHHEGSVFKIVIKNLPVWNCRKCKKGMSVGDDSLIKIENEIQKVVTYRDAFLQR